MNIIRTRQDIPDTEQQVVLDGVTYRIRLTYRGYLESWYMDFSTQDRTPILTGVRLEPGANLLLLADTQLAPAGMLLVVQTGSIGDGTNDGSAVRADLGNGLQLIYVPASEYPS
jgi:hypothetical protein